MSFSRAPVKRFNENVGCAPPPGTYEVKPGDLKGAASFDKSDRFRLHKAADMPPPSPTRSALMSPVRRTMSVDGLIRSLVQQRGDQDRRLLALKEDLKKAEAKLLAAVREKTGLSASVTTLDRQLVELRKVNEFLKNKVSADATKKRIQSLTMDLMEARNTLDSKNKELNVLQINTEGQAKVLDSDLQAARSTVTALKDRSKDLEDLHHVTTTLNKELENENARLQAVIRELREEIKVLQQYLDTANDQIQDLRLSLREKTQENTAGSQVENVKRLETDLEAIRGVLRQKEEEARGFQQALQVSKEDLVEVETRLENQELELESSRRSASDMAAQVEAADQKVQDSQATVRQQEAELSRLREVLRRTEKELDERTQEEGMRRVEELKTELLVLKEAKKEEKKTQVQLQQEHGALTEELTKEKALVDSLSVLVEQEREEAEERLRQLKEELEEVLGELAVLEDLDQRRREDYGELQRQLSDARALLDSESRDVAALKEEHSSAMTGLREAHALSQGKMGDIVTELKSAREALQGAEGRQKELEAEMDRVMQQMKEEMERMARQKEEEASRVTEGLKEQQQRQLAEAEAREESSRELQEVQSRLAQQEEETKAEVGERQEALTRLEELGRLLQEEKDGARALREEAQREREETTRRREKEREEALRVQSALREEKSALEVEMEELRRVGGEALGLQAELRRGGEERESLLSRVELLTQEKVALRWETEEQRRERQRQTDEAQEKSSQETERWRKQYEELFAKVRPFQEQLNAFSAERDALLNENGANQEELNKLSDAYARLLGHQNQKQKIRHVMKLKDENLGLKQELLKLRSQVSRQRSGDPEQSKLSGRRHRSFDPSKAFHHDKENRTGTLREGNHEA
ncbi:Hyaluronan mediated motility receptor [Liparis tanakae]|uniref:Hyaluronan mediated motility receptor n=1 Tax=Liparis tanakae TaxID=230148 RepID=A0A4Z2GES8_9TELE|nr:Hyaluronan mediated motility receptor [Liparis tanakae]